MYMFIYFNFFFCVVTNHQGVESNFVRYDRFKYRSRAQLQMIPADESMTTALSLDAVKYII